MTASDLDERPAGTADGDATRPTSRSRRWVVAGSIVVLVVVLAMVLRSCLSDDGAGSAAPDDSATSTTLATAAQALPVSEIYRQVLPSVVLVQVSGGEDDDSSGIGTGVIVNADGTILTANHVVDGATDIEVTYADGTTSAATVAGADPQQDTAVLTPATLPSLLVPATLGGGAAVGDPVVAVGNPFGLVFSTTSGVVSGLDRTATAEDGVERTGLIQFDAAVNPGSSGGPLLNGRGEVIGIVTALANPTEDRSFIGIGFAVPIATAVAGGGGAQPPK